MVCLPAPEASALGLLHLAFDPPDGDDPAAGLLSSSIVSKGAVDALIRVTFDPVYTHHESETWTVLVIVALGRRYAGRWFPAFGALSAALVFAGVLSPLGLPLTTPRTSSATSCGACG